ncbi:Monopolin complex subunit pcs1 [Frankliniella fusca]|uniref:Monopolin complex subunit pcs1 n=1 Tax=Frankliniella fusca TaxID=407009 RepID=A0AAE1HBZ7_9NEOP|nr:Monopolin complex subunit pcs1 [Frankliniella fusca]
MIMLTCETNIRLLADTKTPLGDGTFNRALKFFDQLYTIYGYINGHNVPLAFFPLPDKKETTYVKMFQFLRDSVQELCGMDMEPAVILLDFEKGAHNAAAEVFKCATRGCKFHFSQSLIKHIQKVPLLRTPQCTPSERDQNGLFVRNDERDWHVSFLGMGQLPPALVGDVFTMLFEKIPDGEEFSEFCDYILETYVDELQAMFLPEVWASEPADLPTTTNGAEGFHADFNRQFASGHPNIHASLQVLLEVQAQTYVKIRTIKCGESKRRKAVVCERSERRKKAWQEVLSGNRPIVFCKALWIYVKDLTFVYIV